MTKGVPQLDECGLDLALTLLEQPDLVETLPPREAQRAGLGRLICEHLPNLGQREAEPPGLEHQRQPLAFSGCSTSSAILAPSSRIASTTSGEASEKPGKLE